jgi:hypothetical protein
MERPAIVVTDRCVLLARPLNLEASMLELTHHQRAHLCDPEFVVCSRNPQASERGIL